jgi:hypothetical protein
MRHMIRTMVTPAGFDIEAALAQARALVAKAEDEPAKQLYLDILRADPAHFFALNELATLAYSGGFRSAARTAYRQAVGLHPGNKIARVNLANLLLDEHDLTEAKLQYEAAIGIDADCHEAHQGLAAVLDELGLDGAESHRRKGFSGHAVVSKPYRGTGVGVPLLLLVSARGGNIPTRLWIDDRQFAVTAIYAEYFAADSPLPPHAVLMNAIGDADLCGVALARAAKLVARANTPLLNSPTAVLKTGRADVARRAAAIDGVIAPQIRISSPAALVADQALDFPVLLRRPGFHTGQHFLMIENRDVLAPAIASLDAQELLVIQYLDARGADGMARKYRVMFVDGVAYPLHLAISKNWKVHYFTADMATSSAYRDEERRFLEDMPRVLGLRAMTALVAISNALELDYAGIDFALAQSGEVILFEANATMVVFPPGPDPMWDYRRGAIRTVLDAASAMLLRRSSGSATIGNLNAPL